MSSQQLVHELHASPMRCVIYLTGGGSRAVSALLTQPGASRTVLEVRIPYSVASLADLLETQPDHALSPAVAAALAERARRRAVELTHPETGTEACVGLGCTAGLATDRPRRGPHCAYVGVCTESGARVEALRLEKGLRNRHQEEDLVAAFILDALAAAAGVAERLPLDLSPGDHIEEVPTSG